MSDFGLRLLELIKTNYVEMLKAGSMPPEAITFDRDGFAITFTKFLEMQPDRSRVAQALAQICKGIPCESCALVSDAYHASQLIKNDGTEWESGEMEHAWVNNTPDKALLSESLIITIVHRDSTVDIYHQPYERVDGEIVYRDLLNIDDTASHGIFIDSMKAGMAQHVDLTKEIQETVWSSIPPNVIDIYAIAITLKEVAKLTEVVNGVGMNTPEMMKIFKQVFSDMNYKMLSADEKGELVVRKKHKSKRK